MASKQAKAVEKRTMQRFIQRLNVTIPKKGKDAILGADALISTGDTSKKGKTGHSSEEGQPRKRYLGPKVTTPLTAIRAKCAECAGWSAHEIKMCTVTHCALYLYRFGKNPPEKRRWMTEEQRQKAAERPAKHRPKTPAKAD